MTIQECHYQFKLGMDRIDTQGAEDFNVLEIDWLLNEAQVMFLQKRYSADKNTKRRGFENTQVRIDDLSTLVIKYPIQVPLPALLLDAGVYEADLNLLAYPYMHLVSAYTILNLGNDCFKTVNLRFVQHDDYRESLKDPFNEPSIEWIPYNFGRATSDGKAPSMYIYGGKLPSTAISNVYIEYIKQPRKISFGGYTYIDGIVYPPTNLEFPEHTHQEIVDIALQIAAMNIESPEYIQLKSQKAFLNE